MATRRAEQQRQGKAGEQSGFVCKTTLRESFLLTEKWIQTLGPPDKTETRWGTLTLLWAVERVEKFVEEHDQEQGFRVMRRRRELESVAVDEWGFAADRWSLRLLLACLHHWRALDELAIWGIGSANWPPNLSREAQARSYPANVHILTTRADFRMAVESLPERERTALVLYYRERFTQAKIGKRMGCTGQWAGKLVRRARALLKKKLLE